MREGVEKYIFQNLAFFQIRYVKDMCFKSLKCLSFLTCKMGYHLNYITGCCENQRS